ncbi:MAG: hypothetical protein HQ589_04325, partial [Syntrophaceae bacterium]|nr:hypothetical protein [Syntrophaceae bacterium]
MFNEYLTTGISEIDEKLNLTLITAIPLGNRYILEPNQYGIDGIGTREILAVAKPFINNGIALYHEICHAAIDEERRQTLDGSSALLGAIINTLEYKNEKGEKALDIYLKEKADKYKVPEDAKVEWKKTWRIHYALRLLQKKKWPEEDRQLSEKIKKQRNISEWIETELVESKRSYVLDEAHIHERFGLFIEVFFELEEKLHIDVTVRKQRKRLLNVCYEIVKAKATAWDIAQEAMKFLQDDMGFDYESLKWGKKSKLMTIIYGIGRASEGTFDYWKGFLERIQNRFGIKSYKGIENIERQKIATAAWYISRGRKAKEDRFDKAIDIIKRTFGISESEIKRDESEGGLGLHEKTRFITAAYAVTLAKDGINEFEQIIIEIGDIVGMSPEDLRKKEAEGGLALSDKIKLISAAYHVAQSVGGLSGFKKSIGKIGKIFGITSAEMKKKEEEGGLTFADKVSLLMSGYRIAMHKNGLSVFTKAADEISNIFGITPDEMSKKKEDGGLALSDKIRLIIAASNVVRGKDGIKTFKATIAKISDIFGITPGEMERKEEEGGLALYDKLRLITAAYQVAVKDSLSIFEQAIYRIGGIFGITPEEMRKKEDEGGLALPDKVSIITAAYAVSQPEDGVELF